MPNPHNVLIHWKNGMNNDFPCLSRALDKLSTRNVFSSEDTNYISCDDQITLRSVMANKYLTVPAEFMQKPATGQQIIPVGFADAKDDDSSQLFRVQCEFNRYIKYHDIIVLANAATNQMVSLSATKAVPVPQGLNQIVLATKIVSMPVSSSLNFNYLQDGSVSMLGTVKSLGISTESGSMDVADNFVGVDTTKPSIDPNEQIRPVQLISTTKPDTFSILKVGSKWCSAYVENYLMRMTKEQKVSLIIKTSQRAWVTIDDNEVPNQDINEPNVQKVVDITEFLPERTRAKVRVYFQHRCANGFLSVVVSATQIVPVTAALTKTTVL